MAKKKRNRTWWYPLYEEEYQRMLRTRTIGDASEDSFPMLFDTQQAAYALALSHRLEPTLNEHGEIVTNDKGYAQLTNNGYIYLIGISGKYIDWKQTHSLQMPAGIKGDGILLKYELKTNKQNLVQVIKETDAAYERHLNSPLAKAGGINIGKNVTATEIHDAEAESGTSPTSV